MVSSAVPLHEQFDTEGQPQTPEACDALHQYFSAVEAVANMTGGPGLNGWSGTSDPRVAPPVYDPSNAPERLSAKPEAAWDLKEGVCYVL